MKIKVLACETLREELEMILADKKLPYDVMWIASGLHNTPALLRRHLQETLDTVTGCDVLLLAFGRCGNSVTGLFTGDYETVRPRADDCISLFFGSDARRAAYSRVHASVYLTRGWLRGEQNLISEYHRMAERYDEETAREITDEMYGHYRELTLLDTGVCPPQQLLAETEEADSICSLRRTVVTADLDFLTALLTGPWDDERFERIGKHGQIR